MNNSKEMDWFIVLSYQQQNNKIPSTNHTVQARGMVPLLPPILSTVLGELKCTTSHLDSVRLVFDVYHLVFIEFSAVSLGKHEHKL